MSYLAALLAGLSFLTWAEEPGGKLPVPEAAALEKATKLAQEVYKKDYDRAETAAQKQALAKRLLQDAINAQDDPAAQFVLLRLARDVAVTAADGETAFQAIDEMAGNYQVDAAAMKAALLAKFAKLARTPAQHKSIAEQALVVMDQAVSEDRFATAEELGKLALAEASKARNKELTEEVRGRVKELEATAAAFAETQKALATLETSPADPRANFTAGRYFCVVKGDWDKGVPMLALGDDAAWKGLAVKDIQGTKTPEEQAALGDSWWNLAGSQKGKERNGCLLRAGYWYEQAQPQVAGGLLKSKLDKRLEEIAKIQRSAASATLGADVRPGGTVPRGRWVELWLIRLKSARTRGVTRIAMQGEYDASSLFRL